MWDHLGPEERQRRLDALTTDMDFGGLSGESFGARDILGLWALQQGDAQRALELWTQEYGEYEDEELSDPRTPLDDLLEAAEDPDNWEELSRNPRTPPELLRTIWEEQGPTAELAEHPLLPMDLLVELLDQEDDVILGAARNAAISAEVYELLRNYENPDPWRPWTDLTVALVASAANTPELLSQVQPVTAADLDQFSGDGDEIFVEEDEQVNIAHARHPCTPLETLEALSSDLHSAVRAAVASNPRCPQPVLQELAVDPNLFVRSAVQNNRHASEEIRSLAALGGEQGT